MNHVSEATRDLLARCGMHDRTAGTGLVVLNKGPGAASDGAHGGVVADAPGGIKHPPIGRQGGERPMGNSGKGPGVNAPAKSFTVLRLVSSRCEPTRPQSERKPPLGVGSHLMLVVSN